MPDVQKDLECLRRALLVGLTSIAITKKMRETLYKKCVILKK